jgi:hypothetical protein
MTWDKRVQDEFWQWYSFGSGAYGEIQIRASGATSWTVLAGNFVGANSVWAEEGIDLTAYAGQTVQIAFYTDTVNSDTGPGWYIDDVTLATNAPTIEPNKTVTFESGLGSFTMNGGLWQVGKPTGGPGAAYAGTNCASTLLAGNYATGEESMFISPAFLVPAASQKPVFNYWQWYSFGNGTNAQVLIQPVGDTSWTALTSAFNGSNGGWVHNSLDLTSYGGQTVQVAFYTDTVNSDTGAGWFLDDIELVAPPRAQKITFPAISGKTYGDAPFTISATASSGLPVSFQVASGPATISGKTVTIIGAGTVEITASQGGNPYFRAAPTVTNSFIVAKESQTIGSFTPIPTQTYGVAPFAITPPTASSGLAVTVAVESGSPATLSGNELTITGAGAVTLEFSQAGDANFDAATSTTSSFAVDKASQTITFPAIPNQTTVGGTVTLKAKASSGLAVTYSVEGPATISGSKLTTTGTGTVTVTAARAANANYNAATSVKRSFTVSSTDSHIPVGGAQPR